MLDSVRNTFRPHLNFSPPLYNAYAETTAVQTAHTAATAHARNNGLKSYITAMPPIPLRYGLLLLLRILHKRP